MNHFDLKEKHQINWIQIILMCDAYNLLLPIFNSHITVLEFQTQAIFEKNWFKKRVLKFEGIRYCPCVMNLLLTTDELIILSSASELAL